MLGSIMVVGVLHFMCDLKASQMNVPQSLIWEFILNEVKVGHDAAKATKNFCFAKGESAIDRNTVTR